MKKPVTKSSPSRPNASSPCSMNLCWTAGLSRKCSQTASETSIYETNFRDNATWANQAPYLTNWRAWAVSAAAAVIGLVAAAAVLTMRPWAQRGEVPTSGRRSTARCRTGWLDGRDWRLLSGCCRRNVQTGWSGSPCDLASELLAMDETSVGRQRLLNLRTTYETLETRLF